MLHPAVDALALTGERTAPGWWHESYWFARHEAAYRWVVDSFPADVHGALAVEAGSGEGYGADLVVSAGARAAVGLDYDTAAVRHAHSRYGGDRTSFTRANLVALPLADACADLVLTMQVVEHIWTPHEMLAEIARVLRPGGLLTLTTPNRLTFSPGLGRGEKPLNPFHVAELDADELASLVGRHLDVLDVLGLHHGPRLDRFERAHGSVVDAQQAAPAEAWDRDLADVVRSVRWNDFAVSADSVDDSLDLVVVARARAVEQPAAGS